MGDEVQLKECPQGLPVLCDWLRWGEHIKSELNRAIKSMDSLRDRVDSLQTYVRGSGDAEHIRVEALVQKVVEDLTAQIREVVDACKATAQDCAANRDDINKIRMASLKYSSIVAGVVSLLAAIAEKVF